MRRQADAAQGAYGQQIAEVEEKLRRSEQEAVDFQTKAELGEKQRIWEASVTSRQSSVHAAEKQRWQDDLHQAQQAQLKSERQVDAFQTECGRLKMELTARAAEE